MKLSIALLAAPAVAFAPQAQQAASVKLEAHKEVAAATLAAGALLAPFAAFAGDIESGETLFAGNCAACVRPRPRRLLAGFASRRRRRGVAATDGSEDAPCAHYPNCRFGSACRFRHYAGPAGPSG